VVPSQYIYVFQIKKRTIYHFIPELMKNFFFDKELMKKLRTVQTFSFSQTLFLLQRQQNALNYNANKTSKQPIMASHGFHHVH